MYEIVFSLLNGAFSNPLPCPVLPARGVPFFFKRNEKTDSNEWVGTHLNLEVGLYSELVLLKHCEPGF